MYRVIIVVFFLLVALSTLAQGKKVSKPQTLFSINNEPVLTDEFNYIYKKNHQNKDDFTQEKLEEYLNLFINFKLKVTEARSRGLDTTAVFLKEYNSYKDEIRKPYLPEGRIVDSLVELTYTRLKEEVKVSHILIMTKPDASPDDTLQTFNKAVEIKARAVAGEDFASLAALYSQEPSASTTKGDLGYFTALQMVYPFENAAYSGKVGEIVGPVRTRFGYHVLKIADRKPARGEVEVSHIMIRTGERDAEKARNLAFEIHDQLRGGMKWEELCKQYSEDPGTKNNGGKLRPFGVGAMNAVPEFDRVAFSLEKPGDISDPFQTQYGWHIVRLEKKIPLPSFAELSANLKGRVSRDERVQVSKQALLKKLKKDFLFKENETTRSSVFALADSSLIKGKWNRPAGFSNGKEMLFSLQGKSVTANDFFQHVIQSQKPNSLAPARYMQQLYDGFVEKKINEVLEEQIIRNNPEYSLLLKEYYEGILLFDIMEKEVWKKASEDSVGQHAYYNAHVEKYKADERAVSVIYSSGQAELLTQLKKEIEQNDTTAIKKSVGNKSVRQERGTFQQSDRPALAKVSWQAGLHPAENNGIYYLVEIKEIIPPGALAFEEARAQVISDYQDHLEKSWLAELKKKYPVKINEKVKKQTFQQLKP